MTGDQARFVLVKVIRQRSNAEGRNQLIYREDGTPYVPLDVAVDAIVEGAEMDFERRMAERAERERALRVPRPERTTPEFMP